VGVVVAAIAVAAIQIATVSVKYFFISTNTQKTIKALLKTPTLDLKTYKRNVHEIQRIG
jgi:hypothetical protein